MDVIQRLTDQIDLIDEFCGIIDRKIQTKKKLSNEDYSHFQVIIGECIILVSTAITVAEKQGLGNRMKEVTLLSKRLRGQVLILRGLLAIVRIDKDADTLDANILDNPN